jgi:hypothetical protein
MDLYVDTAENAPLVSASETRSGAAMRSIQPPITRLPGPAEADRPGDIVGGRIERRRPTPAMAGQLPHDVWEPV